MKYSVLVGLFIVGQYSFAASFWIEPNIVDTEYSVYLESMGVHEIDKSNPIHRFIPYEFSPYNVTSTAIEVYKGDIEEGNVITVLVYLSPPFERGLERINDRFILSFCKSKHGIFYTHRNFVITKASEDNIKEYRRVKLHGTAYEGDGDCSGNYPNLNPDTHH